MNENVRKSLFPLGVVAPKLDSWSKLMKLAELLEIDERAGTLTIRNGKSVIALRDDGRITIEGVNIVERAEKRISLDAAAINLN